MEEAIKYKNVIREYFLEYKNRDQVLKSIFYVILFGASFLPFVFGSAKEGLGYIWLIFPMALALFAAITHTSALPTMLYLVPGSKKLREEYIRRMLKVKIGLPLALCAVIDIILLIVQPMMIKGVILQLVTVFFMSYCVGIRVRRHLKATMFRHSLVCRRSRHSISAPVSCIPVGCGDGQKSVSPVVSVADCSLSVAFVLSSFVVNAEITTFNTLLLILPLFMTIIPISSR